MTLMLLALFLMFTVPQSAPAPYTVPALGPSRALVEASGNPAGFVDMGIFYTWSGTPVAYHREHHIYRFDGKHLGWFYDWRIYDHEGRVVMIAAPRSEYPGLPRGNKDLLPAKGSQERAPAMPALSTTWSSRSAGEFFQSGRH
jgi:hypothetical protein